MDQLELANRFDRERRRLRSVAYRIVGSLSEADDAVQEARLRLERAEVDEIDNLEGWLTTVAHSESCAPSSRALNPPAPR